MVKQLGKEHLIEIIFIKLLLIQFILGKYFLMVKIFQGNMQQ
jgi:hypothetical protein